MKSKIIILTMMLLTLCGSLAAQEGLIEYLEIAAKNNPALKAKFNDYMAALEKIPQARALPDPIIAFGYFIQPIETRLGPQQAKISAAQMFPWFGTLSARANSSELLAKAKFEQFMEQKAKLFYDVKTTYFSLYFTAQASAITGENLKILISFKTLTDIKIASNEASSLEAYRLEMETNNLENKLQLLNDISEVLKVKFNILLNREKSLEINLPVKLEQNILNSKQEELDSIMIYNHSLLTFDYQMNELKYRELLATKEGMPQFTIGLEYALIGKGASMTDDAGKDAFVFPTIGIALPLYRSKYKAKVQEAEYLFIAKSFEKNEKQNNLLTLFEMTWKDYQDAERRASLFGKQYELAQKSLAILESKYTTGNIDFEEILRMQSKLLEFSLELQRAYTDKETAIAFIRYLQGKN